MRANVRLGAGDAVTGSTGLPTDPVTRYLIDAASTGSPHWIKGSPIPAGATDRICVDQFELSEHDVVSRVF